MRLAVRGFARASIQRRQASQTRHSVGVMLRFYPRVTEADRQAAVAKIADYHDANHGLFGRRTLEQSWVAIMEILRMNGAIDDLEGSSQRAP